MLFSFHTFKFWIMVIYYSCKRMSVITNIYVLQLNWESLFLMLVTDL